MTYKELTIKYDDSQRAKHKVGIKDEYTFSRFYDFNIRRKLTEYIWIVPSKKNIEKIAKHLKDKKVLEVGSGSGIIGHELRDEYGIDIKLTDISPDEENHYVGTFKNDVEKLDAIKAFKKYRDDVDMILSIWPPYESTFLNDILIDMKVGQQLLYVGEGYGGCTGDSRFWDIILNSKRYKVEVDYEFDSYWGIHDYITLITRVE